MILCGVAITGFCVLVMCDIVTRLIGRPWLWLQEVTMTFFIYGIFIGFAAATRRKNEPSIVSSNQMAGSAGHRSRPTLKQRIGSGNPFRSGFQPRPGATPGDGVRPA